MGLPINKTEFSTEDYEHFQQRLQQCLGVLKQVLADPDFGGVRRSYGAELELYLFDDNGLPLDRNLEILNAYNDPLLTLELNRFNLEYNCPPEPDTENPFSTLGDDMESALARLRETAADFDTQVGQIGILPTLTPSHFGPDWMTDLPRYHALTQGLQRMGSGQFKIHIDGHPPLLMERDDVTMEGACTSFQFHYRVRNGDFARMFNAFMLVTPIVLGLAANSPTIFGHRLWCESRIPLFKHSIDPRVDDAKWRQPARVSLGQGWVRQSAYELFAQTVAMHPPLLPICSENAPGYSRPGQAPALEELMMHHNTVWPWIRPVYDAADDGHLRVELRALPAGPTVADMMANAALYIGLAEGVAPYLDDVLPAMPFSYCKHNFYRAAQFGLDATVVWPSRKQHQLQEVTLAELVRLMLPIAEQGLQSIDLHKGEISNTMDNIRERLDTRQTGAAWQLNMLNSLTGKSPAEPEALAQMLLNYQRHSLTGKPVAQWRYD